MRPEPDLRVRVDGPGSSLRVRRAIREMLGTHALDPAGQAAQLAAAELINNVVLHTVTGGWFAAWWVPGRSLRIEVGDDDATMPTLPPVPAPSQLSGRGLHIVDTVASRWGMHRAAIGKVVWYELDWPDATTLGDATGAAGPVPISDGDPTAPR